MAKLSVDCDGVLADFGKAFFQMANKIWPGRVPLDYINRHWNDLGGLSSDEQNQVWERIKGSLNWWLGLEAFHENIVALERFLVGHSGHDVYIVTSRTPSLGMSVAHQTDQWLWACGVRPHANYLGVIATDYPSEKALLYKSTGMAYSVDDKLETVLQCQKLEVTKGHKAFLLDRPWNQSEANVHRRIKSLAEFFKAVR